MKTIDERISSLLSPIIDVRAPYAKCLIVELKKLVLEEREACAKLIEALPPGFGGKNRNDVAEMIRHTDQES